MSGVSRISNEIPTDSGQACQHTLYYSDRSGKLLGSWRAVPVGNRVRVECRECGKFFSYLVDHEESNRIRGLA